MTAKRKKKEKDVIDLMLDKLDFHGMTKDELTGSDGLLRQLTSRFYERVLEAEMDEHLGYRKHDNAGDNTGNSRNGYTEKSVILDDNSTTDIHVPRDRNSTFEPVIIPKHEKRSPLFNDQIISMYSYGMSCRDIQRHLQEVYGVNVSAELISNVTESVMMDVREWQNRPLDKSYPILFLDALRVNCRQDGKNVNKALYVALAINWEGKKEVLGLWLSNTEGAKFWMGVLSEIKNRGTEDILIACMDGLTGFPEAVKAVFPDTHIQHCIVHMVRSSTKFVSYKDLKAVCKDLKEVYSAINEKAGAEALEDFGKKWDEKYPMIKAAWQRNWNELVEFFNYPEEIRKAIYTTNAIESLNFSLRKITRNKSSFPDDDSIYKVMYLTIRNASKRWTMPIRNWPLAVNQFAILFDKRVSF
ncbi:IS256 family transposase [Campylobacter sp. RM16187]|uniref:IS256 family transposase n=1 Tax=Campylobacter sp. RM16187 TaxID=1660063 RepID=UPI00220B4016|nr:mutator family transposase [Campylobacter sp. RM16187]